MFEKKKKEEEVKYNWVSNKNIISGGILDGVEYAPIWLHIDSDGGVVLNYPVNVQESQQKIYDRLTSITAFGAVQVSDKLSDVISEIEEFLEKE